MSGIWVALALVLIIEGVGPLLFPKRWQAYLRQIAEQPAEQLRRIGGVLVTIGVVMLVYFA